MMATEIRSIATSFPALASMGLNKEHLAALAKQGNLRAESTGRGNRYYKLRFRIGSQQQVRYVGNDRAFVDQVERELICLQKGTKTRRRVRRLTRTAKSRLRETRRCLEPVLANAGFYFHGREVRRRPRSDGGTSNCKGESLGTYFRSNIMDDRQKNAEQLVAPERERRAIADKSAPTADRRRKRLRDLYESALEVSDPLRSSVQTASAELFEVASLLTDAIKDEFAVRKPNFREIQKYALPVISTLSLVHRQATRYVQLAQNEASRLNAGQRSEPRRQLPNEEPGET
jgi:hypothetical protein